MSPSSDFIRKYKKVIPFKRNDDGNYIVLYACVCLIDECDTEQGRSFEQIREKARQLKDQIQQNIQDLQRAEEDYCQYLVPFSSKKHPPKKLTYGRGKKRTKFYDKQDARNYKACWRIYYNGQKLKEKKSTLLKAVIFFAISLRPSEVPTANPEKFIQLARDYHARWGIENGFKEVKHAFLRPVRSTKPINRQYMIMVGMELYGRWHVDRITESLTSVRTHYPRKIPWNPKRPYVRRKLEQDVPGLVTARCYLIRLWGVEFRKIIKNLITQ